MKKIRRLSLVLFIFSVLALSYPATHVFAQEGAHVSGAHLSGGQCDSNPACNPASGTCCGQCDPGPACNPNDPNAIPCCSLGGNNMTNGSQSHSGHEPPRHPGKTNDLDPRLVEKMDKMRQELKECQSLKEEIKGQQQRAPRQAPARCQPDTAMQRQLAEKERIFNIMCLSLPELLNSITFLDTLLTGDNQNKQYKNSYLALGSTRILDKTTTLRDICVDGGRLRIDQGRYIYTPPKRK